MSSHSKLAYYLTLTQSTRARSFGTLGKTSSQTNILSFFLKRPLFYAHVRFLLHLGGFFSTNGIAVEHDSRPSVRFAIPSGGKDMYPKIHSSGTGYYTWHYFLGLPVLVLKVSQQEGMHIVIC